MPVDGSMYVEIGLPCAAAPVRHASKRSEFFICVEPKRFEVDHKFTICVATQLTPLSPDRDKSLFLF